MAALGIFNLDWSQVLIISAMAVAVLFFGGTAVARLLKLLRRRPSTLPGEPSKEMSVMEEKSVKCGNCLGSGQVHVPSEKLTEPPPGGVRNAGMTACHVCGGAGWIPAK